VHPPLFHENKIRTIAKADVAGDLNLRMARTAALCSLPPLRRAPQCRREAFRVDAGPPLAGLSGTSDNVCLLSYVLEEETAMEL
jgi:hypothetical protein